MARDRKETTSGTDSGLSTALQRANDLRMVLSLGRLAYRAASLATQPEPKVSTRRRVIQFGVPLAIAAASSLIRPAIRLNPHVVEVDAGREVLVADVRDRLSTNGDVLLDGPDGILVRFTGRAGVLPYRTLELVRFDADCVDFEHLGGSFHSANERFSFAVSENGRTQVRHTGEFAMRGGLITWPFGWIVVKPLFERHVADHMAKTMERFRNSDEA